MNREMRRLQEREERRQKNKEGGTRAQRKAAALQSRNQPAAEKQPFYTRLKHYLHEVRQELRKVTWPTQDQMIAFTTVTVITSTVLTGVVFGLDFLMKQFVLYLVELRS